MWVLFPDDGCSISIPPPAEVCTRRVPGDKHLDLFHPFLISFQQPSLGKGLATRNFQAAKLRPGARGQKEFFWSRSPVCHAFVSWQRSAVQRRLLLGGQSIDRGNVSCNLKISTR